MAYEQKPWHRDPWVGLCAAFAALMLWPIFHGAYKATQLITVPIVTSWELEDPTFGQAGLRLRVWRHYPDIVEHGNAVLTVRSNLLGTGGKPVTKAYSFPSWSPNEENAREFFVPLSSLDNAEEVEFDLLVDAREMRRYHLEARWDGTSWIKTFAEDHKAN